MPSLRAIPFMTKKPSVDDVFVASSASVIGDVKIGSSSSVWYGAIVRGDVNSISIGNNTAICERVMVHCSGISKKQPTVIGNNVTVKAGAIVHGCKLADGSVVGENAQVLDGAEIGTNAMIGAGSIVIEGTKVPGGQLWSGIPAAYSRDLTEAELESMRVLVEENTTYAAMHAEEDAKTWEQMIEDEFEDEQRSERNDTFWKMPPPDEMIRDDNFVQNHQVPGRILDHGISARNSPESRPQGSGGQA